MIRSTQPRREHLIETARRLFNAHGYHQTGIDLIMRESGVSKTTMYKYFATKEDLIAEVLRRRSDELYAASRAAVDASMRERPDLPRHAHYWAMFSATEAWTRSADFCGCMFMKAASEYAGADDPVRLAAAAHKTRMEALAADLFRDLDPSGALAAKVMVVSEGAVVTAFTRRDPQAMANARAVIAVLVAAAGGGEA
mgnify:CR=1 FL=1